MILKSIYILLSLLFLSFSVMAESQYCPFKTGSEPDGFRGIKWGTDIATLKKQQFIEVESHGDVKFYEKKKEHKKIGNIQLSSIKYGFWKGNFYSVRVDLIGFDNNNLLTFLKEKYGGCNEKSLGRGMYFISWKADISEVSFMYGLDKGRLMLLSNSMTDQVEQYLKRR